MTKLPASALRVYCDFDGTISLVDIGREFFRSFGAAETHREALLDRSLSVAQYWRLVCASIGPDFTETKLRDYALAQPADPYFRKFVEFCRSQQIPLTIVSDGFETYARPFLQREGAGELPLYANRLTFSAGMGAEPVFPMASESCGCFCASCKRNAILRDAPDESVFVYIGDGISDFCAAEHSDIVFAKSALAAHCNRNHIPHYPFKSFFDVIRTLEKLCAQSSVKTRNQARLKRLEALMSE